MQLFVEKITKSWITFQYQLLFHEANPENCHFLKISLEKTSINIRSKKISSSFIQKLLRIYGTTKLFSDHHVKSLCRKASQKLNASSRDAHYVNLSQRKVIMKAFIFSQFGYSPLVWMFHSRRLSNRINNIHERALQIVCSDHITSFRKLLKKYKFVTIHQKNVHIVATVIFKIKIGLTPEIIKI